jgi:hypothetical protein
MTPETTALVWRLRRYAEQLPHFGIADFKSSVEQAAALLSQERTCSTCQHLRELKRADTLQLCLHPQSAAFNLSSETIGTWGCLLWEQADPKESA